MLNVLEINIGLIDMDIVRIYKKKYNINKHFEQTGGKKDTGH